MARPKDADSEKTVSAIVEATLALVDEQPRRLPSLRGVAKRAGVTLGAVQYYFDTKEDLFEACLDGCYERLVALGMGLFAKVGDQHEPGPLVEAAVLELYRFALRERRVLRLRQVTNANRGELHPRRQRDVMGDLLHQVGRMLEPYVTVAELDARLSIQAVSALVLRFALLTDEEARHLTGLDTEGARLALEGYVVRSGRRLVRPGDG